MRIKVKITRKENADFHKCSVGDTVEMAFEDYIKGVVPSEIGNAHIEACKAQAIASRTYAYSHVAKCTPISDASSVAQAYRAPRSEDSAFANAHNGVTDTFGMIQTYNGKVINSCPYSASNGGKTTSSEERWGGKRAWLISKDDPWDLSASGGTKKGHGVGMSQSGAKYAAQQGKSYTDILSFYYVGCSVSPNYGGGGKLDTQNQSGYNEKCKKLIAWAISKRGCDYVWGATGKDGKTFDCATFVRAGQKEIGIIICAGASSQWNKTNWSTRGTISTLPNCPCILYRENLETSSPMAHTGIYLGNNLFCDARGSKSGVLVNQSLSSYPWTHWAIPQGLYNESELNTYQNGDGVMANEKMVGVVSCIGTQNLRETASTTSSRLLKIPSGANVKILEVLDGWYRIDYNGTVGYVASSYIIVKEQSTSGNQSVGSKTWSLYLNVGDKEKAIKVQEALKMIGLDVLAIESGDD